MQNILLVGQDPRLLSTRAEVLKKTGANITCCGALEAYKFVGSRSLDLVVLCHTLAVEESESIAERAHRHSQRPRILLVISDLNRERSYRDAKFDATSLPDPTGLIARATELLKGLPDDSLRETVCSEDLLPSHRNEIPTESLCVRGD